MGYPNTGSTLNGIDGPFGPTNKTSTGISTNIVIKVGPNTVGAIQDMTITENRPIIMIDEVGTDGHIDSVPNKSTDISGNCSRIRFDRMRVSEAFGRGFVHVASQRIPFDIVIIDNWNGDGNSSLITTIKNVWIEQISYGYKAGDWIITDQMNWKAETIYTTLANGNAATGGERSGFSLAIDPIERSTDIGGRRGSLDAPGLLKAFLPW